MYKIRKRGLVENVNILNNVLNLAIEDKQKCLELKLDSMQELLKQNININEFDSDVFEAIIKNVIIGGYDSDGNKQPFMISFIFSSNRKTLNTDMEYTIVDSISMKTNKYTFERNRFNERRKVIID